MRNILITLALLIPVIALANDKFTIIEPGEMDWQHVAEFDVWTANLLGAPDQEGLYIQRIKFPANTMSRPHYHDQFRYATVIKGTWWVGFTREFDPENTVAVPVGSFMIHPIGEVHYDGARDEEVIVEIRGYGPVVTTRVDQ
jgi:quercetin dioxygenase-like cupin family protein